MDLQEDLIDQDIILSVQLPGGQETTSTVHGSKPVMDVLVTLCAQHHLIPSDHVLRLISANQNHIHFKPNSPIGSLEFEKVVLQAKGADDANRKKPHIPVATVRLMINYKKSHKAVLRVNPRVPLAELMPSVCEKCELNPDTTILLRTCQSEEPLDLTKTLNDYGIRELYAKDIKGGAEEQKKTLKEKNQREKEKNKGFFSLFKKSKKTPEQALTVSTSASSELNNHAVEVTCLNGHSSSPTTADDMSKKRRAPQPPPTSQTVTCALNSKDYDELSERDHAGKQGLLSRISSTESSLKRTKRKAPPPPCDGPSPSNADNKENVEEDDNSSDKYRACIADRFPAIAQVMTELLESLQARQQRALSSVNSATSQHQTTEDTVDLSELSEEVFKTPSGCQLIRNSCRREGLATFTVVPQRCRQSRKHFEAALTRQAPETAIAGAEEVLSPAAPEGLKIGSTELAEEAAQSELCRNGGSGLDKQKHLSEVPHLQHLKKQNQAQMDKIENLDQKCENYSIHLKNVKKGELEPFQRGFSNLESPGSKMNNLELRNAELKRSEQRDTWTSNLQPANKPDESPVKLNIEESLVKQEEYAFMETGEERNWIEEYKERRRKFGGGNNEGKRKLDAWGRIKRALRNTRTETIMQEEDDHFPPPPPPVCWYEGNSDGENDKKDTATNTQAHNVHLDRWPSIDGHFDQEAGLNSNLRCKPLSHLSKPNPHSTQSNPEPKAYDATPEPPGTFLTSRPNSGSMSGSTSDPCSTETMSLFALTVFQKAKHFRPGPDHNHSKRRGMHTQ